MSEDLKTRWDKLPTRVQNLFKRYWLVGGAILAAGLAVGFILGKLL